MFMVFESIDNAFILTFFSRQRSNTCSLDLINSVVMNLLCQIVNGFFKIFILSFNDGTIGALILCEFPYYIPGVVGQVAKTIFILACIY